MKFYVHRETYLKKDRGKGLCTAGEGSLVQGAIIDVCCGKLSWAPVTTEFIKYIILRKNYLDRAEKQNGLPEKWIGSKLTY